MQFVFYAAEALLQQVVERRVRKRIPLSDASHSFSSDLVNEHPERSLPPCLVYLIQFFFRFMYLLPAIYNIHCCINAYIMACIPLRECCNSLN
jgi:hypothetical protein